MLIVSGCRSEIVILLTSPTQYQASSPAISGIQYEVSILEIIAQVAEGHQLWKSSVDLVASHHEKEWIETSPPRTWETEMEDLYTEAIIHSFIYPWGKRRSRTFLSHGAG